MTSNFRYTSRLISPVDFFVHDGLTYKRNEETGIYDKFKTTHTEEAPDLFEHYKNIIISLFPKNGLPKRVRRKPYPENFIKTNPDSPESASYLNGMLEDSLLIANECHKRQLRFDGSPFIKHPYDSTRLLLEMKKSDPATKYFITAYHAIAQILHDIVEDSNYNINHINFLGEHVKRELGKMSREVNRQKYNEILIINSLNGDGGFAMNRFPDKLVNTSDLWRNYLPNAVKENELYDLLSAYIHLASVLSPTYHKEFFLNAIPVIGESDFKYLKRNNLIPEEFSQVSLPDLRRRFSRA